MVRQSFNNQSYWLIFLQWLLKDIQTKEQEHVAADSDGADSDGADGPEEDGSPGDEHDGSEEESKTRLAGPGGNISQAFLAALVTPGATEAQTGGEHTETITLPQADREHPATAVNHTLQAPHSTAVFWGDSIAHGMATSVRPGTFANVVNLATPGAGFLTSIKPQSIGTLPQNSAAFIYFGTNDVASLIGQSDEQIAAYARRVIDQAEQMKAQGADVVILGLNAPKGAYTGGSAVWRQEGFVERWTSTMERLNEQYRVQAEAAGIRYAATDAQITNDEISSDNLHLTTAGNRELVSIGTQALKS
ncbi:MAG: SGNH/GDSL hydrolase family protein [Alphaproteobacteria bacterium]|nr:SGNH/GDSL hydrolase family protein [Alphaproteobacteria bacterium]